MSLKFGKLPKIEGAGRKGSGIWPGHAKEAQELRDRTMANLDVKPEEAEVWAPIVTKLKVHAASRIASSIKKGVAVDFIPDATGHFDASCRRNPDSPKGKNALYDVWACYIHTGPEQPKRRRRAPSK